MSVQTATALHDQLQALAKRHQSAMLRLWDHLAPRGFDGQDQWHDTTKPLSEAVAQASIQLVAAYMATIDHRPAKVSPLVVADAGARMFDPYDRMGAALSSGSQFDEALDSARSVVEGLSLDTVSDPARSSLSYLGPHVMYGRRLNGGACEWCMSFDGVEFPFAEAANFGHNFCQCQPFPIDDIGDQNTIVRDTAGFDAPAQTRWEGRHQRSRLTASIDTAKANQARAAADQLTEADPARLARLSTREQEWETRAEAAAERLRILDTGTHRLAA